MMRTTLIAALGAATLLSGCMEDMDDDSPSPDPVVVVPAPAAPATSAPVVAGQPSAAVQDAVAGKGPVVTNAS